MRITSTGNVGIGTSTPTVSLSTTGAISAGGGNGATLGYQLLTTGGASTPRLTNDNSNWTILRPGASGAAVAINNYANSANLVTITDSGSMGIGITSPSSKLEVSQNYTTAYAADLGASAATYNTGEQIHVWNESDTGTVSGLSLTTRTTGQSRWDILNVWTNTYTGDLVFRGRNGGTSTFEAMRVTSSGNVGVGTTTPNIGGHSTALTVSNTSSGARSALEIRGNTSNAHAMIDFYNNTARTGYIEARGADGSANINLMPDANVGIGTASPQAKLSVATDVNNLSLGAVGLNISATSTAYSGDVIPLTFTALGGTARARAGLGMVVGSDWGKGSLAFYTRDASNSSLLTTSDEKMRIASDGSVGIGTTNPGYQLQIADTSGTIAIGGSPSSNGTGRLKFINSNSVTNWQISTNDSTSGAFEIMPSTAAGGSTFTTAAFMISSSGNVGIGRSPGVRLDVQSTADYQVGRITAGGAGLALGVDGSGNGQLGNTAYGAIITLTSAGGVNLAPLGLGYVCSSSAGALSYGASCATSDERLKTDIANISSEMDVLAALEQLNGVYYKWDLSNPFNADQPATRQVGMIAQNVEQVFPELVSYGADGYARLDYQKLVGFLVEVDKAQQGRINALDARTSWMQVASSTATSSVVMTLDASTGYVGIGTATPSHMLQVAGDIAAISFVNTSTRTAKTDIAYANASTTEEMLGKLMEMNVATYRYTIEDQNDPLRLGLIAEDVQAIAPEVLSPDQKGVDIYKLATFTLAGVQALAEKVNAQNTRLTSLEDRVAALESGAVSAGSSTMSFSSSTLASALEGFGVLIQKGIAQFNTLVFRQLVASKDADGTSSAGTVTILAGNTVAQVNNSLVAPTTKVFVTFNGQVAGSWWVSDKANGSFRVVLSAAQAGDVSFDYFLVQTEGQIGTPNGDGTYAGGPSVSQSSGPDVVAPTIALLGDNPLRVSVGGAFVDPGVTVTDNADGALPYTVFVNGVEQASSADGISTGTEGTNIITYRAMDRAGNVTTVQRSVIVGNPDGASAPADTAAAPDTSSGTAEGALLQEGVTDTTAPVVTLSGAAAISLEVGGTYADAGATASDETDGDLTASITVSGAVDTATEGLYTVTYSATDAAGNTGSASRAVSVVAPSPAPAP